MLILCIAFVAGFLLDVMWALCIHAVSERHPISAANYSVLLYLCALISTLLIVDKNVYAIVAYAIGGWIGTYVTVNRDKK